MFALMDKLLERVVPKATASADTSYYKYCGACGYVPAFDNVARLKRQCHVVGGTTSCGPCNLWDIGC
ncbi:hypothetical protein ACFUTV_10010 [Streptomyces sp. NPDC057298]|uniref:hypothetical protein n=1 Tax=Streptomyces sp. NPDC057298 TaxID=3346091 RepID=UPI00363CC40E